MDPQEFAQKVASSWQSSQQGGHEIDIRIVASQDGYTLRDLKGTQEQSFTGPDAEQQCQEAFTALLSTGRSKVS